MNNSDSLIIFVIVFALIVFIFGVALTRWIFRINKQIDQNEMQIQLLAKIALANNVPLQDVANIMRRPITSFKANDQT